MQLTVLLHSYWETEQCGRYQSLIFPWRIWSCIRCQPLIRDTFPSRFYANISVGTEKAIRFDTRPWNKVHVWLLKVLEQRSNTGVKLSPVSVRSVVNLQKQVLDGGIKASVRSALCLCGQWSLLSLALDHREFSRIRAAKRITSWLCKHFV